MWSGDSFGILIPAGVEGLVVPRPQKPEWSLLDATHHLEPDSSSTPPIAVHEGMERFVGTVGIIGRNAFSIDLREEINQRYAKLLTAIGRAMATDANIHPLLKPEWGFWLKPGHEERDGRDTEWSRQEVSMGVDLLRDCPSDPFYAIALAYEVFEGEWFYHRTFTHENG